MKNYCIDGRDSRVTLRHAPKLGVAKMSVEIASGRRGAATEEAQGAAT
jgi:hypothetical protein